MIEKGLQCKSSNEFNVGLLVAELRRYDLSVEDRRLIGFLEKVGADFFVEKARDLNYLGCYKSYLGWRDDEDASRDFWYEIEAAAESSGAKMTPDEKEAFDDARLGSTGKEAFASIMLWFINGGFIRKDITVWNCRIFRYLDSYMITKENIVGKIFVEHYEDIEPIEKINERIRSFLDSNMHRSKVRVLSEQIDKDERAFEAGIVARPAAHLKRALDAIHEEIKYYLADDIFNLIFSQTFG